MSYLYYIDELNNVLLHPDAIKLCEELRVIDEKEIAAIIYAYDYFGPFRQFAEPDRKRKALVKVYGSDENNIFEKDKVKNAVEAYMGCQYNAKMELLSTYDLKISNLQRELIEEDDERAISRILSNIEKIKKSKNELDKEIYEDLVKQGRVVGGASLSFLQMFQKNTKAYKNIMPKEKKKKE